MWACDRAASASDIGCANTGAPPSGPIGRGACGPSTRMVAAMRRVMAGAVCGSKDFIDNVLLPFQRNTGPNCAPFNAWVVLKGLETLSLRVERHVENALKVVDYLAKNPHVAKVNHPALPDHPDHELYKKYFPNGGISIFTFEIKGGAEAAKKFIDHLKVFSLLANVADVKSLVIHPASTTHSQLNERELVASGVYPNMLRFSLGIEHIDDLKEEIGNALKRL